MGLNLRFLPQERIAYKKENPLDISDTPSIGIFAPKIKPEIIPGETFYRAGRRPLKVSPDLLSRGDPSLDSCAVGEPVNGATFSLRCAPISVAFGTERPQISDIRFLILSEI